MRIGTDAVIEIRPVISEDLAPLRRLLEETRVFTEDEVRTALELIDIALVDPENRDYLIQTAVDTDLGVLGYYCIGPTPLTVSTYDLYWIAVKPSNHSRGTGRQLLRHAEETVRAKGGTLVIAETSGMPKYENTRQFYLKNDYAELARIRNYYKVDDDLVVYGKYLSQS